MKILVLSHTRKLSNFKIGSHHYANNLSIENDVSYIGSPISILHKVMGKRESGIDQLNKKINYVEITPIVPISKQRSFKIESINLCINSLFKKKGVDSFDLIICDTPYFFSFIKEIEYKFLIYRPTDDYLQMDGKNIISYEKDIVKSADAIIATSEVVLNEVINRYEKEIKGKYKKVIENGYDDELFFNDVDIKRQGAVYIGALDKRFDFNMLGHLASNYPNCTFDIFGPLNKSNENEVETLRVNYKNINFNGEIKYYDIPATLNRYKVGLLLLKDIAENKGRSPMKLWEYLSCGLNVIYSTLEINDDNKKIDNLLRYNNKTELVSIFKKAMEIDNPTRQEFLKKNAWRNKTEELMQVYKDLRDER